jgi:hypothetical protein
MTAAAASQPVMIHAAVLPEMLKDAAAAVPGKGSFVKAVDSKDQKGEKLFSFRAISGKKVESAVVDLKRQRAADAEAEPEDAEGLVGFEHPVLSGDDSGNDPVFPTGGFDRVDLGQ